MASFHPVTWRTRTRALSTEDHTLVMGVLNVTPDSFSDGGVHGSIEDAVAHGRDLAARGADIVDVGGESTRPGAEPVAADEEMERVIDVVSALSADGIIVSIDTAKAVVAEAAVAAGAEIVNDVTALADPQMAAVCARSGAGVVLMHMRGTPRTMQDDPVYEDVVAEVSAFLEERVRAAVAAGIDSASVCIDPGIGFGKLLEHNLALLHDLAAITSRGRPVLVGTSRKRFIGRVLEAAGLSLSPERRDVATAATTAAAILSGAAVIRAHDVSTTFEVARMTDAIVRFGR